MGYIEEALGKDEKVIYKCHASKGPMTMWIVVAILSLLVLVVKNGFNDRSWASGDDFNATFIFIIAFSLLRFIVNWVGYNSTELCFTNRRVIAKQRVIKRHTIELDITKVTTVTVAQEFLGRKFNYGSLVISGAGNPQASIHIIDNPMEFHRKLMEYLEEVKQGESKT